MRLFVTRVKASTSGEFLSFGRIDGGRRLSEPRAYRREAGLGESWIEPGDRAGEYECVWRGQIFDHNSPSHKPAVQHWRASSESQASWEFFVRAGYTGADAVIHDFPYPHQLRRR